MSNEWFYAKAGKREGPVSIDDLKRLVHQGQLQRTDHVWTQGMEKWLPAGTVEGLFAAEPPPLPTSTPLVIKTTSTTTPSVFTKERLAVWMKWLDDCKIKVSVVWFLAWFFPGLLMSIIHQGHPEWLLLFGGIGTIPAWVFWARYVEKQKQRTYLHGLWEPVSGDGVYFQFTKDGALVRGDGIATRYRWLTDDKIELYTDEASPKVEIEVLSLSKMEMVVSVNGQGGHFKKGTTITEAQEEAARQAAWNVAKKVGAVAGGAALLAVGGLAVLTAASVHGACFDRCPYCGASKLKDAGGSCLTCGR